MANDYHQLPDAKLDSFFNQFLTVVGVNPTSYGMTAGNITSLTTVEEQFADSVTVVTSTRAAAKAATQQRDANRQSAIDQFAYYFANIYNNPSVTDAMIAEAGLAPRDGSRTKKVPYQPANLAATPSPSGSVTLTWDANGNTWGATYVVECQAAGAETWTFLGTSTKRRETFLGFTPGVETWFRVTAQRNGEVSEPSYPASIYAPAGAPPLKAVA